MSLVKPEAKEKPKPKPKIVEPVITTRKFKVVQEVIIEEIIEIEATSEIEAIDAAAYGGGTKVDETILWPTLVGIEELEDG